MLIGEMLVRAGALTPAALEEAIGWQVVYGGRLGTNLLELGLVDEKLLAQALGRQHGCEWTFGPMELPESIVRTVPASVARRHEIVPWRIEGRRFKVLSTQPGDNIAMLDELGFKLGLIVKPVVAPEFRVHQLLRRYFGSIRQQRALDFGVRPAARIAPRAEETRASVDDEPDLMDDEAFASIYAQAIVGGGAGAVPGDQHAPAWLEPPDASPEFADASTFLTPIEDDDLPLVDAELIEDDVDLTPPAEERWAAAFAELEAKSQSEELAQQTSDENLSALTFAEAASEIARADGRDEVARAVLRYARSVSNRAVLLNVQGDVATGWDAVGEGLDPLSARRIVVPLETPSVFRLVRDSRSHYIGPLGKDAGNVTFLKLAGKKWPASASLMPILFHGRVVYILYTDNGHKQLANPDVGELLVLAQNISRSMEQMVARRAARR